LQVGHLDQVAVGIAEIKRSQRPGCAGLVDRAYFDRDARRADVRHRVVERHRRDQAEIGGAGRRLLRARCEFVFGTMQVELLRAEGQRLASGAEGHFPHAQHLDVETYRCVDVGNGQHHVVQAVDRQHA